MVIRGLLIQPALTDSC